MIRSKKIFFALILILSMMLSACGKVVVVPVDLPAEVRAQYEAKLAEFSAKLQEPDPEDPQGRPLFDYYIEKARYQQYLGRLSEAEATLKEAMKKYETASAALHNLAKIYEQMGRSADAAKLYRELVTSYEMPQYSIDIAHMERLENNVQAAGDAYWQYQEALKAVPDAGFEEWLRTNNYKRP